MINNLQAGYKNFCIKKDNIIIKKKSKLSLDFGKIDKSNMMDYHD